MKKMESRRFKKLAQLMAESECLSQTCLCVSVNEVSGKSNSTSKFESLFTSYYESSLPWFLMFLRAAGNGNPWECREAEKKNKTRFGLIRKLRTGWLHCTVPLTPSKGDPPTYHLCCPTNFAGVYVCAHECVHACAYSFF